MPKVKWLGEKKKKPPYNHLAAVLRGYKLASGKSSADIGEELGVTGNRVQHMIAQSADAWNIGRLRRFCDAIGCPLREALEAAGK